MVGGPSWCLFMVLPIMLLQSSSVVVVVVVVDAYLNCQRNIGSVVNIVGSGERDPSQHEKEPD